MKYVCVELACSAVHKNGAVILFVDKNKFDIDVYCNIVYQALYKSNKFTCPGGYWMSDWNLSKQN